MQGNFHDFFVFWGIAIYDAKWKWFFFNGNLQDNVGFFVFTYRSVFLTHSVGTPRVFASRHHIFLCLKKDMGERQIKGAAAPLNPPWS